MFPDRSRGASGTSPWTSLRLRMSPAVPFRRAPPPRERCSSCRNPIRQRLCRPSPLLNSETGHAVDNAAADFRHELKVEGLDGVESRVIVRIAHECRVGEEQRRKPRVPEGRMVAETHLRHEKSVPDDGQGLDGKAVDFFERGGETL